LAGFPPVLILAGGKGTRLSSVLANTDLPKSMVDVLGQPFIAHQLHLLKRQGAEKIILCVGHQEKPLRDFVENGEKYGLAVNYSSDRESPLGTGGAVLKASQLTDSPFIVLYGDSYLDIPLGPVIEDFERRGKPALMTVYHNKGACGPSNLLFRDSRLIRYDKEAPTADMEHIDFGLSIFSRAAFDGFTPGSAFDLGDVVKALIARGDLAGHEVLESFHEVGTAEGLKELEKYMRFQQSAESLNT
jgi:NDP-sugar pyrophosphorylase family protein